MNASANGAILSFDKRPVVEERLTRLETLAEGIIAEVALLKTSYKNARENRHADCGAVATIRARWLISRQVLRDRLFNDYPFSETAWNVLLDLFVADQEGRNVAIGSACIASKAAFSSGLRCCQSLENQGLIERRRDPQDGRRVLVQLTAEARDKITDLLSREMQAERSSHVPEPPPPEAQSEVTFLFAE